MLFGPEQFRRHCSAKLFPISLGINSVQLLFVCTGNTCRSALAVAIADQLIDDRGIGSVEAVSAGTSAWDGAAASDGAMLVGLERKLDLSGHRARQLTPEIIAEATLILAMGPHHLERINALGGGNKAHLLSDFAEHSTEGRAIEDPFGGGLDLYRTTADELEKKIARVLERITAGPAAGPA